MLVGGNDLDRVGDDLMQIVHPDNPTKPSEVSERAFETTWSKRGWEPAPVPAAPAVDPDPVSSEEEPPKTSKGK